ncbi:hypothetical protein R83H12_02030 [Fibrobacteria bacterium R8-3-H12]
MSAQRYELQCSKLKDLKKFLVQFDTEMLNKLNEFKRKVQQLSEAGLPQETTNKFHSEIVQVTETLIKKNSEFLLNTAVPFVGKNIEILESLIEMNRHR